MSETLKLAPEWDAEKRKAKAIKAHGFLMAAVRLTSDARRLLIEAGSQDDSLEKTLSALLVSRAKAGKAVG